MPPSTLSFAPPFFALVVKALLGHIGAGIVHRKTLGNVLEASGTGAVMINVKC